MKLAMRNFWRVGGVAAGVLALGACAVGVPEETDDTPVGENSDGLVSPIPGQILDTTPYWVGSCSQAYATYLVRVSSGSCSTIATTGGSWMGCRMHPNQPDFCIYKWNKAATPSDAAYLALQSVAAPGGHSLPGQPERFAIAADCSTSVATCGTPMQSGTLSEICGSPEECCEMKGPTFVWFPETQECKNMAVQQPSCDVCGFIRNGTLYVVHDPLWPDDTDSYAVFVSRRTWIVERPLSHPQSLQINSFVSPLSVYYNTPVTVYPR